MQLFDKEEGNQNKQANKIPVFTGREYRWRRKLVQRQKE